LYHLIMGRGPGRSEGLGEGRKFVDERASPLKKKRWPTKAPGKLKIPAAPQRLPKRKNEKSVARRFMEKPLRGRVARR